IAHGRARGRAGRITASVNPLVPKPGTAYQWMPMAAPASIERAVRRLRALTAGIGGVTFSMKSGRHAVIQALLSLGDRRVAPVVVAAERNGGQWRSALAETGVDASFYVHRDRSRDAVLPWEILDSGTRTAFYRAEFARSLRAEPTGPGAAGR
ncbi:MAG TPA: hypothetical protein PKZ08_10970, partial [Vicinamibacterales bacterium]|nr:hypothetical protein [Vicinamibacterales bacterium]